MAEETPAAPAPDAPPADTGEPAAPAAQQDQQGSPATGDDGLGEGGHKALAAEREAARVARREAATLRKQLEQVQRAQMSDTERAIAEARESTAAEVRAEFGQRLARSALVAAAATAGADLGDLLDFIDLKRFVGDDGEPDDAAIKKAVAKLPKKQADATSFDGGPRGGASTTTNMSAFVREQLLANKRGR
jgi:hypothetical protein